LHRIVTTVFMVKERALGRHLARETQEIPTSVFGAARLVADL